MKVVLIYHIMPWEIDYALLSFSQLKKSKYHLTGEFDISIYTALNLSSNIIDWNSSKLPKEFFIEKYNDLSKLLIDYTHIPYVYEGDLTWGHLDLQKIVANKGDYYIAISPDIAFSDRLLYYLLESAKRIKNDYFVLTPQIGKFWDSSWDVITNTKYLNNSSLDWDKTDVFDIIHDDAMNSEIFIEPVQGYKWAGWFDLYNNNFYDKLCPVLDDWCGYGGWDMYGIRISEFANSHGVDVRQYVLRGETIFEYSVGPLYGKNRDGFGSYYKKFISFNDVDQQRKSFDSKFITSVHNGLQNLYNKGIIL